MGHSVIFSHVLNLKFGSEENNYYQMNVIIG